MIERTLRGGLVAGFILLVGCSLFYSEPEKLTVESEYDNAFNRARSVISSRFPIKSSSRKTGKIKTRWKEYPSDVLTERKRLKATVKKPEDAPNDVVRISLRSEVQTVENSMKNYRTEQADWDDSGRDHKLEQDLLEILRFKLRADHMEREIADEVEKNEEQDKRIEELKKKTQNPE